MKQIKALAKKIFKVVEADLRDRRGIRHEWDAVDDEIQKEIRETNVENIIKVLASSQLAEKASRYDGLNK